MYKERYFLIKSQADADALNAQLQSLELDELEYETDYEITETAGILVVVSWREDED